MAQIIDIVERRRPRLPESPRAAAVSEAMLLDPTAYLEPVAQLWQSWLATWGSLWLAPWGLRVLPVEAPLDPAPKHGAGPRD